MNHSPPLVSIAMPVRNCQTTLPLALKSVEAQTYSNWELLLIDDGSSDRTIKALGQICDSRIKICSDGQFVGITARLNQAIEMGRGKYFARMDGDDIAYPERLDRQVDYLERNPSVDLVGCPILVFRNGGIPLGKRNAPEKHNAICRKPFAGFPISHPTYIGRIEWFRRHKYRWEAKRCEDQDMLVRSYRFSRFANVPKILLGYREDRIDLRKVLTSRRFWSRCLFHEFMKQRRPDLAVRGYLEQVAKGILDCTAVVTGLNYRLLQHRAMPISEAERSEWYKVWVQINGMRAEKEAKN